MYIGKIKSYCKSQGDGMITPRDNSVDVYFTKGVVVGATSWLQKGICVAYTQISNNVGSPEATSVWKIKNSSPCPSTD